MYRALSALPLDIYNMDEYLSLDSQMGYSPLVYSSCYPVSLEVNQYLDCYDCFPNTVSICRLFS